MELTKEQIESAQKALNQDIEELEFEDSVTPSSPSSDEVIPETTVERPYELIYVKHSIGTALSLSREVIESLKTEYKGLTITGIQDKDGIITVGNALKRVKDMYRNVEKKREELKAPVLKAGKEIDSEAKELSTLLKAVIDPLEAEDNRIKTLIELEKTKVQREQEKLMNERLSVLKEKGAIQQGVFYCVGETVSITPDVLKTMDLEAWNSFVKKVEEAKDLEDKRIAKEQEEKAELNKAQEELDKLKQNMLDNRVSMRKSMISILGYVEKKNIPGMYDLSSPEFPDVVVNLTIDHLEQYDDAAFMKYLTERKQDFDNAIVSRRAAKDKEVRLVERSKILEAIGMEFVFNENKWKYKEMNRFCYRPTISDLSDAEFTAVVDAMKKNISAFDIQKQKDDEAFQLKMKTLRETREKNRITVLPSLKDLQKYIEFFQTKYAEWLDLYPSSFIHLVEQLAEIIEDEINPPEEQKDVEADREFGG